MGHLVRGKKTLTCGAILSLGLVREASEQHRALAVRKHRLEQAEARKRGHSQPLATKTMKRRFGTVVPQQRSLEQGPPNAMEWHRVVPACRLKRKMALDEILASKRS